MIAIFQIIMKPCLETDSPRPFLTCLTHRTAVYFASVCPVDCTGAWLSPHQAPAVIDECGDCNGLGRARDCRGVCRGPFAQTVVDGVAKARRGRMAVNEEYQSQRLPSIFMPFTSIY